MRFILLVIALLLGIAALIFDIRLAAVGVILVVVAEFAASGPPAQ